MSIQTSKSVKISAIFSIQSSVIIGAMFVSASVLLSGGIISLKSVSHSKTPTIQPVVTSPSPSANPVVSGVTDGNLPVLGNSNAKVSVVEFGDYQCPFCQQFFQTTFPQIMKDYIDTGKVKFAYRDYPFLGVESTDAASAARCANEQGRFWDYHDYLFNHQGQENSDTFSKDNLKGFAANLGLNTAQFDQCLDSDKYTSATIDDSDAGKKYGVINTPTIFVNGEMILGSVSYDEFKTAIDNALAHAY